jgi:hypothetical protein
MEGNGKGKEEGRKGSGHDSSIVPVPVARVFLQGGEGR